MVSGRSSRLSELKQLFEQKKYSEIAKEYFGITTDVTITPQVQAERVKAARAALIQLLKTNAGKRIAIALAHKGISSTITISNNKQSEALTNSNNVTLNVTTSVKEFEEQFGSRIKTTLTVVLGHELGHAVLGYNDLSFDYNFVASHKKFSHLTKGQLLAKGENVLYVENPLRSELGLPARPSYVPEARVKHDFPELFGGK